MAESGPGYLLAKKSYLFGQYLCLLAPNLGIEGLKDKINKLKPIEFLQFSNSQIPQFLN